MAAMRIVTIFSTAIAASASGCHSDRQPAERTPEPIAGPVAQSVLITGGLLPRAAAEGEGQVVASFLLDTTEVTVAAYERCVAARVCTVPTSDWDECNWRHRAERGRHPVNCVDWTQATAYCQWQGLRLPTEAEWEFAASGTEGWTYPWGEAEPREQLCWEGNPRRLGEQSTCPVGSYPAGATPLGVLDMAGNVWEWTSTAEVLPGGVDAYVLRGGGWGHDDLSSVVAVRNVDREVHPPSHAATDVGFRCAMSK